MTLATITRTPTPPVLSFSERDRRWAASRDLMRAHDIESLLVAGFRAREMYESYMSDDYTEGYVVFPLEGDPVALTWAHLRVLRARDSAERGQPLWIPDYRVATDGAQAARVVLEKTPGLRRLGVIGLRSSAPCDIYGAIPAGWWLDFSAALSGVEVRDLSEEFSHMMLVKSAEELAQVRYAAAAAEAACDAMAEVVEAGVGEQVAFAAAVNAITSMGIGLRYPSVVLNSGPHTLSWGPPRWLTRGEMPRRLERGDLVQAELMPLCGNQEAQVQMVVALDPLDEVNRRCEPVARACYEAGLAAARPGMLFSDLVGVMEEPLKSSGCWSYTPLVHSLNPHFLVGFSTVNTDSVDLGINWVGEPRLFPPRDAVLKAGMVLAFEPNACIGDHRVNIGGTVIITETGCEELNNIPTRVTHR